METAELERKDKQLDSPVDVVTEPAEHETSREQSSAKTPDESEASSVSVSDESLSKDTWQAILGPLAEWLNYSKVIAQRRAILDGKFIKKDEKLDFNIKPVSFAVRSLLLPQTLVYLGYSALVALNNRKWPDTFDVLEWLFPFALFLQAYMFRHYLLKSKAKPSAFQGQTQSLFIYLYSAYIFKVQFGFAIYFGFLMALVDMDVLNGWLYLLLSFPAAMWAITQTYLQVKRLSIALTDVLGIGCDDHGISQKNPSKPVTSLVIATIFASGLACSAIYYVYMFLRLWLFGTQIPGFEGLGSGH